MIWCRLWMKLTNYDEFIDQCLEECWSSGWAYFLQTWPWQQQLCEGAKRKRRKGRQRQPIWRPWVPSSYECGIEQNTSESYELGWKLSRSKSASHHNLRLQESTPRPHLQLSGRMSSKHLRLSSKSCLFDGPWLWEIQFDPVADQIPKSTRVLHQIPKTKQFVVDCQHFARWERWEGQEWCQGAFLRTNALLASWHLHSTASTAALRVFGWITWSTS